MPIFWSPLVCRKLLFKILIFKAGSPYGPELKIDPFRPQAHRGATANGTYFLYILYTCHTAFDLLVVNTIDDQLSSYQKLAIKMEFTNMIVFLETAFLKRKQEIKNLEGIKGFLSFYSVCMFVCVCVCLFVCLFFCRRSTDSIVHHRRLTF